ncbi:hypothetical protein T492DRAFT_916989 [Pavlovales sp. CCMP2436]|nr:hypothetical protein T492DRAFT_916989 [Pavlovales sp. CCMP2436]
MRLAMPRWTRELVTLRTPALVPAGGSLRVGTIGRRPSAKDGFARRPSASPSASPSVSPMSMRIVPKPVRLHMLPSDLLKRRSPGKPVNGVELLNAAPRGYWGEEIEAAAFIRANPLHDGRGIIVGVLDTGVDPGAPGLLTTSDGRPKIIDLVDCTGSGDVDTSHLAEPSAGGMLNGLSGRALALPPGWPPSKDGKYRLGLKEARKLDEELRARIAALDKAEKGYADAGPAQP